MMASDDSIFLVARACKEQSLMTDIRLVETLKICGSLFLHWSYDDTFVNAAKKKVRKVSEFAVSLSSNYLLYFINTIIGSADRKVLGRVGP
jgi:hypothetical protein